MPVNVNKVQ